jgi:hypothetical protein
LTKRAFNQAGMTGDIAARSPGGGMMPKTAKRVSDDILR